MNITLLAKSSSGGSYDVEFTYEGGVLIVKCSCRAGIFGKLCKHKTALLKGDKSMLYDSIQKDDLTQVQEWIEQSNYPGLFRRLKDAERQLQEAKKHVSKT